MLEKMFDMFIVLLVVVDPVGVTQIGRAHV